MKSRRTFLMGLTCTAVALAIVALPVLAEELIGRISAVDVSGRSITVKSKGEEKDLKVAKDAVYESPTGEERKLDLEKLKKRVDEAEKGVFARVTYEGDTASKIRPFEKGDFPKGFPKKKDGSPKKGDRDDDGPRPERKTDRPEP